MVSIELNNFNNLLSGLQQDAVEGDDDEDMDFLPLNSHHGSPVQSTSLEFYYHFK